MQDGNKNGYARAAVTLMLAASAAGAAWPATLQLSVDASQRVSAPMLKLGNGVNGPPNLSYAPVAVNVRGRIDRPADVSAGYRAARVNLVRTHDAEGAADLDVHLGTLPPLVPLVPLDEQRAAHERSIDLNVMFPDLAADPADPHSYRFGPTDQLIESIHAIGADVIFRLGRDGMATVPPPADLVRYAEIVRHVVQHYNKGWADGFQNRVKYWEIWNEPDLGHIWWNGTPEEYYTLYSAAAQAVKAADPKALVGGPTIALVNETSPYREGFLAYARDQHAPLDFYSWHWYSTDADDPYDFNRIGVTMRRLLDQYGFTHTISVLDEWNDDFRTLRDKPRIQVATFVTSALIYMEDAPIDLQALYRADAEFPAGATPTKLGQALIAWGAMKDTPRRLPVTGGDTFGLAPLAGSSRDGRKLQVLLSNDVVPADKRGPRPNGDVMKEQGLFDLALLPRREFPQADADKVQLELRGLAHARYQVQHYRISGSDDSTLVGTVEAKGPSITLSTELGEPAVDRWVLTRRQ